MWGQRKHYSANKHFQVFNYMQEIYITSMKALSVYMQIQVSTFLWQHNICKTWRIWLHDIFNRSILSLLFMAMTTYTRQHNICNKLICTHTKSICTYAHTRIVASLIRAQQIQVVGWTQQAYLYLFKRIETRKELFSLFMASKSILT